MTDRVARNLSFRLIDIWLMDFMKLNIFNDLIAFSRVKIRARAGVRA
jgi:hypothetical protein